MILSIGEAPIPPYSFGQCSIAQPASYFFFCHNFASSRTSLFAKDGSFEALSLCLAFFSNHSLQVFLNLACSGVSLKSIFIFLINI